MIDTRYLEGIIGAVRSDKNLIHYQVRKVEKNPDHISIEVFHIRTESKTARLQILMGWQVEKFVRYSESSYALMDVDGDLPFRVKDAALSNHNTLRLKWFYSIVQKLNERGEERITFIPDEFEFGAGAGCIWAALWVEVEEREVRPGPTQPNN